MLDNRNFEVFLQSLKAAEDQITISSTNIANAQTLGYKALEGHFATECNSCTDFETVLSSTEGPCNALLHSNLHLQIQRKDTPGGEMTINGQSYEKSNVEPGEEFAKIAQATNMIRNVLAAIQIENKVQQDIVNLGRGG